MAIPERFRASIKDELDALVHGERRELMTWVVQYGDHGAVLIEQPDEIWTHAGSNFVERSDGSAYGLVPLWTTDESPSDLSAEFEIDVHGVARLSDVHVL